MPKTAIALRHLLFEDLGSFSAPLIQAGYDIRYLEVGVDDLAPAATADLLIVLGGPVAVYELAQYPYLGQEIDLLATRLAAQRPTLGICLGAQLVAAALGARVYPGPQREIGWLPLQLSEAGRRSPLRHLDAELAAMFHWHGDTFDLPAAATLLASTAGCRQQAFALGQYALAFQCHPELDPARIEQWLIGHAAELGAAGIAPAELRRQTAEHGSRLQQQGRACLAEWLALLGPCLAEA